MGDFMSKLSEPDSPTATSSPTASAAVAATTMSSPNSDQPNSKTLEHQTPIEKKPDPPVDPNTAQIPSEEKPNESIRDGENKEEEGGGGEEEEEECGFCLFMKGGECKETFTEWEKCVDEGERNGEDIVEKCYQVTTNLRKCMEEHSDYYAPLLQAEKAAEAEAVKQLEADREGAKKEEESGDKGKEVRNLDVSDENKSS